MKSLYLSKSKDILEESLNEAKKPIPFDKVKPGQKAIDYNNEDAGKVIIKGKGLNALKIEDKKYDCPISPNEFKEYVDDPKTFEWIITYDGEDYISWVYGSDGAEVYA
jgi:hypothetical protein